MIGGQSASELRRRHNLPPALTSFVGRTEELGEVRALLGRCRLVTVVGPGGSGKSRLAVEAARGLVDRFQGGVWLVELAHIDDPMIVPAAVARVLEVHDRAGMSPAESLAAVVGARHTLLILDNCEHLVDAVANLCGVLLGAGDDLRILATSRTPLQEPGEARYPLPPLPVPDTEALADDCASVTLFMERARGVNPHVDLGGETSVLVGEIVRRLDGLPLAIELTASQTDAFTVAQLASNLVDDHFEALTSPIRTTPTRHASLHATVEWSYRLLDETARRAFRRLSVFPAPFTLEAAGAVVGPDAWKLVAALVRNSLLTAPRTGPDGRERHGMLETLRAYGMARLEESHEREAAMSAMAAWMLHDGERAAGSAAGPEDALAGRWGDAEHDNALAALEWSRDREPDTALRLAIALSPWAFLRGRYWEGQAVLQQALDRSSEHPVELAARGARWLGRMVLRTTGLAAGLEHFARAVTLARTLGPSELLVDSMNDQTVGQLNLGQSAEAVATAREARELACAIGYPSGESYACHNLALSALYDGDFSLALSLAEEAYNIESGDVCGHTARYNASILAGALALNGDLRRAEQVCTESLRRWRSAGDSAWDAHHLETLARIELRNGKSQDAFHHLDEAIAISAQTGFRTKLADSLATAAVAAAARNPEAAAMLWGAGRATLGAAGSHRLALADIADRADTISSEDSVFYTQPMLEVRGRLGIERASRIEGQGKSLSIDDLLDLARTLQSETGQSHRDTTTSFGLLSKRERDVLILVAEGLTDAEIAEKLFISIRTVHSHLDRIREKTGARRRTELTRLAVRTGVVDAP